MTRKVWSKEKNRMFEMPFFRLNLIHDYNIGMNAIPSCLFQNKETSKIAHAKARWTLKVATLKGDPSIPGIVALSLYDRIQRLISKSGRPLY